MNAESIRVQTGALSFSAPRNVLFTVITGTLALISAILALGFSFQMGWAKQLYPWEDGRLSYIWVGSMFSAYAFPLAWLAIKGTPRLAWSGMLALALTAFGLALHFYLVAGRLPESELRSYSVGAAFAGLFFAGMAFWTWRSPVYDDSKLTPPWLRFCVFAPVVLIVSIAAVLLLVQFPGIFPWPLKPETSVMFGIIFAFSGFYHAFTVFQPGMAARQRATIGLCGVQPGIDFPLF